MALALGPGRPGVALLLLALLAAWGSPASSARPPQDWAPPLFNLSLDSPPEERWGPLLQRYDAAFLRRAMARMLGLTVPKWVHNVIRPIADIDLELFVRQPYAGEIRGMAKTLDVSAGDALLLNLCYEATAFCTSIIAQDRKGNIYHGRNMDYDFGDTLKKLTVDLQFVKDGKIAYKGTTFVGYVGLWTGQNPHKFSISGDERDSGAWWENAVAALLKRSSPVSWLVRDTLNEAVDFQAAVLRLAKTPIIADVYYIVGGAAPDEGVVITRDRSGPANIWPLDPLQGGWFRVETNYDHWTTPPPYDDRRTAANKAMNTTGQDHINLDTLYEVLSVTPVLNKGTIYTTVMSSAFPNEYRTRIRANV